MLLKHKEKFLFKSSSQMISKKNMWNPRILISILFLIFHIQLFSQTITVNDSGNTPEELVDILIGNSCISKSNFNISSNKSVAYFNNNSGSFPISEGVIIRNGIAEYSGGLYTNENMSSQISMNGDVDLQNISDQSGQSSTITDVAFLEFDFIPLGNTINFNFLLASNEYGEYQCGFSDVFAIILTNMDTGESVNLAVLPNTDTPISVKNIRDKTYNSSCSSINPNFFSTYNVNSPLNSSLNMRGHTKVMNASANVIIETPYRIKFAIGDSNDSSFDSAVFIETGSFETNFSFSLGEDQEICEGNEITLASNYTNTTDFSYLWHKDGIIIQGEDPFLKISETGTYKLIITSLINDCSLENQITIRKLAVNQPNNIYECATNNPVPFNLTLNDHAVLGVDTNLYDVLYYNTLNNATNDVPINTDAVESYPSIGDETIFLRLKNKISGNFCNDILSFDLITIDLEATTPEPVSVCQYSTVVNIPLEVESQILINLNPLNYTINYFTSLNDAITNENKIINPANFQLVTENTNPIVIWARVFNNSNNNCFEVVNFTISVSILPLVDSLTTQYACLDYTLPSLVNGSYYTEPGGNGTQLFPGEIISENTKVYINNINSDGCQNETNFSIFIADEFVLNSEYCGQFVIPDYQNAFFYTAPLGPNATGEIIPLGTILTESQSIYFYAENEDGSFCLEKEFPIIIYILPPVDTLDEVITCNSYVLPSITNGNYYAGPNGSGNSFNAGDIITTSKYFYIYNLDSVTNCESQSLFRITIIDTNQFEDLSVCANYTIPNSTPGNYYTQPNGEGNIFPGGSAITSSQTIYFYAPEVTTTPNCTVNIPINITINTPPLVDELEDILICENDLFILPSLTNGNYYTASNKEGTPLFEGDIINTTQTIYIYNENALCEAETSFLIEIRTKPLVDNFTDILSCDPYILPTLTNGAYFTEPNGQGTQLNPGDIIENTQLIYIYNNYDDLESCANENVFQVNILGIEVDKPDDKIACETYELPVLTVGEYFTQPNGLGTQLNPGTIINETQTIYIYAENGNRFSCKDEHEFTITVFNKPILENFPDIVACESVTLPTLAIENTTIEYYNSPNRVELIDPSEYTISEIGTKDIYVYAYPTGNANCFTEDQFQITVNPLLNLVINGGVICVDQDTGLTTNPFLLESKLEESKFTVHWYLNNELVGTGPNHNATKAGDYRVETVKLTVDNGVDCNYAPTIVVVEASIPKFEIRFLTEDFVGVYAIEVHTIEQGLGEYLYAIDSDPFQSSNQFENVIPGE